VAAVVFCDELADARLHRHVQPDCRFVEEEDLRAVQQRSRQLALHALAERELAHLFLQQRSEFEQLI